MSFQECVAAERNHRENESILHCLAFRRASALSAALTCRFEASLKLGVAIVLGVTAFVVAAVVSIAAGSESGEIGVFETETVASASVGRGNMVETTEGTA